MKSSIGIHFIGLNQKERSIFDRVIAFNVTHGLQAHTCEKQSSADLIIFNEASAPQIEQTAHKQTQLVLANNSSLGDVQIATPLLITRVMKGLETAIKLHDKQLDTDEIIKPSQNTASDVKPDVQEQKPASTHHALIIDDSAAIRKQLELELRDAGITSDFAESGEVALEKIKNNQFDLVFLDIIMPGIDGYETCKAMRATAEYKKTPIIMLSGKTSPLDEVQGVIAGATTYLTKPVKSTMLQETLNRVTKWIDNYASTEKKTNSVTA